MSSVPAGHGLRARWHAAHARWHTKHHQWRHSMRHSLKWRIVIVFMLLALAMTGVFLIGAKKMFTSGWQTYAKPLVGDYIDKLALDIGSPPSLDKAKAIVARLPVTLKIDGPQVHYNSHPNLQRPWSDYDDDPRYGPESWGLVRSTADGHRITFGLVGPLHGERPRVFGWITLGGLLVLTLAAYAYVRRMLRPLQSIGEGVARFGRGDFGQPIPLVRRDELGDLSERINQMATSLHGMLDAKRALLLAISHELRSPLTRARVNAVISDLLEGERLATGHAALQTESVDPAALVRELVATQFAQVPLTLELDGSLPPLQADPMRLKLLLRNLIDNALRHSAGAARSPVVSLSIEADGRIALAVRDFGPGVSEEQLQRLAEPFYRPDSARTRAGGGVGLGLYLCRLVAQAHGGELRIRRAEPGLDVALLLKA
jgi:signal transduction histidine kinase